MKTVFTQQPLTRGFRRRAKHLWNWQTIPLIGSICVIALTLIFYLMGTLYSWGLPTLPHNPYQINIAAAFTAPNLTYWMGTDHLGRDIFGRIVLGTMAYTIPAFLAVLVTIILGVGMGSVWGYYGSYRPRTPMLGHVLPSIEVLINYTACIISSFPRFVLILMVCAIFSTNIYFIMIVVGITSSPILAEVVKNKVLALKEQNFIEAAQAIGVRPAGIIFRHIIWHHCKTIIIVQSTYLLGYVVFVEASLSYLGGGFGVQEPFCSWGNMLASGKEYFFEGLLWPSFFPAAAIVLTILSFTLLGDGISQTLKLQKERG